MSDTHESQDAALDGPSKQQERLLLGDRVRVARVRAKLSQEDLAAAAGVGVGTIKNIESAKTRTQRDKLTAVLAVLGLDRPPQGRWSQDDQQFAEMAVTLWSKLPEQVRAEASGRVARLLGEMLVESALSLARAGSEGTQWRGDSDADDDSVSVDDYTLAAYEDEDLEEQLRGNLEEP